MRQSSIPIFVIAMVLLGTAPQAPAAGNVAIEQIADAVYMLTGRGGNVAVSIGEDGVLIVDDQYPEQYAAIRSALDTIDSRHVRFVLNTHWHSDHTGGNAQLATHGATVVAHENVRQRLATGQVIEFFNAERPAAPKAALPIVTFSSSLRFHVNGDDISVLHVGNAHTDGDAIVHFRNANVIHTGDVYFNGRYPFIDIGTGGSAKGMIAAVEQILDLCDDDTRIVPGHGPLATPQDLLAYLKMLRTTREAIARQIISGNTMEQAVLARPTAAFDSEWGNGFLRPDQYVRMIYGSIQRTLLPTR